MSQGNGAPGPPGPRGFPGTKGEKGKRLGCYGDKCLQVLPGLHLVHALITRFSYFFLGLSLIRRFSWSAGRGWSSR